jgi:hypothetical protein
MCFLRPTSRCAQVSVENVAFVGGRALLGGAIYVGNERDERDHEKAEAAQKAKEAKDRETSRRKASGKHTQECPVLLVQGARSPCRERAIRGARGERETRVPALRDRLPEKRGSC